MLEEGAPNNEGVDVFGFGAANGVDVELTAPKLKLEVAVVVTEAKFVDDFEPNVADIEGKLAEVVAVDG